MKNILHILALLISFSSFGQTADEYFNSGYYKDEAKDYYGAISDYTKAIEVIPNDDKAYFFKGLSWAALEKYDWSISDFNKSIELEPNFAEVYYMRGLSKYFINDLNGACQDVNKSKSLGYEGSTLIETVCN